jgi:hypothetical protein
MEQWRPPDCGTLRITNPKTLEKWIHNGQFKKKLDEGLFFGIGCGRFKDEPCVCSACRNRPKKDLQLVINKHFKP